MTQKLISAICSILLFSNAMAQPPEDTRLFSFYDSILNKLFQPAKPGGAVIVTRGGEVIYKKAFGMADLELDVPMQTGMVFRIGSITKQFTAVAILQLAEQGKLSLQDDIRKFVPDFPASGKTISIEHLLTHTSGIKNYTSLKKFDSISRRDLEPGELIEIFKHHPPDFEPGEKWSYNNSGYALLGFIIEKLSGKSYGQYIKEHLFIPAGMHHSGFDRSNTIIKNRAKGYQSSPAGYENADYISMTLPYAAGSLVSTVEDLSKWNLAVNSYKLVSKKWLDKAYTDFKLNSGKSARFGYGWLITRLQGSRSIDHGGVISGFSSEALYLPDEDVYIAILTNCTCHAPEEALIKMAAMTIGKPYVMKNIGLNPSLAGDYEGKYVNENGEELNLMKAENGLKLQWPDGSIDHVIRFETDKFFFETNDLHTIHFSRTGSGEIEKFQFRSRLQIGDWKKIKQ